MEFFRRRHEEPKKFTFPNAPVNPYAGTAADVIDLVKSGALPPLEVHNSPAPTSIIERGNTSLTKMRENLKTQKDVLAARIARDSEDLRQINLMLAAVDKGLGHISNDVALTKDASESKGQ